MVDSTPNHPQIPFASGVIHRPRLLEQLQIASEYRLTVVSAPPGFGKTTLVAQFAHQTDFPVVWQSIQERERDLPYLYDHSIKTLSYLFPDIDQRIISSGHSAQERASLIADFLQYNATDDFFYILDDVHYLAKSTEASVWLRTFVEQMPAKCHLVLVSREVPSLPLTEMIARREVLPIGQEQLRFTLDELTSLAGSLPGTLVSHEQLEELDFQYEGWPAGLVLALQPLPVEFEQAVFQSKTAPSQALFNALADTMLYNQTPQMRDFLMTTSILSSIIPERCHKILGFHRAERWINLALERNLFLSRVSEGLVYHRLFHDFLLNRFRQLSPNRYRQLNQKAMVWYRENHDLDSAFRHAMMAGEINTAMEIAESVSRSYSMQGKVETLLGWKTQLGAANRHAPQLLYDCAIIHTERYEFDQALDALNHAEAGFEQQHASDKIIEVRLQQARIDLRKGRLPAPEVIADLEIRLTELAEHDIKARVLHLLGLIYLRQGNHDVAIRHFEESLVHHRTVHNSAGLASVLQDLEVAYTLSGRMQKAGESLQQAVAIWRSLGRTDALAAVLNNLGFHYHQQGDYQEAHRIFKEGLSITARTSDKRAITALLWSMGDLERDLGKLQDAMRGYQRALEISSSRDPFLQTSLWLSLATAARWQENYDDALYFAQEAKTIAETNHFQTEILVAQAMTCILEELLQYHNNSAEELDTILQQLLESNAQLSWIQVLGFRVSMASWVGNETTCFKILSMAEEIASDNGNIQPLIAEICHSPSLKRLFHDHKDSYPNVSFAVQRLESQQVTETQSANEPQLTETYSLRVYTLGQEQIERDGVLVESTAWRAKKAYEFFLYLLFKGAKRREEICEAFWPDQTAKQVRSNFHTTLYRIRKAVGDNIVIFQDDRYMLNPQVKIWCDAQRLEQLTNEARLLPFSDARTEDLWQQALKLYEGEFLSSLYEDWVLLQRDIYNELYIEVLIGKANCVRYRKDCQEAIRLYKQCLDFDPYRENAHRAIMKCYADLGEKHLVLEHFLQMKNRFQEDLGVDPSPQTIALAKELIE